MFNVIKKNEIYDLLNNVDNELIILFIFHSRLKLH